MRNLTTPYGGGGSLRQTRQTLLMALLLGASSPAIAQSEKADRIRELSASDVVVVTAQRREETSQTVPISVSAASKQELRNAGLDDMLALQAIVPGFQFNLTRNVAVPYMRGVGTSAIGAFEEGSVATYVDGVYIASLNSTIFNFSNIERVEVLKGPQGTLFGRNAVGGLVHIITRDPQPDVEADFEVGYESYENIYGSAYVNTPLSEKASINISAAFSNQQDGWGGNPITGEDVNINDNWSARGKFLYEASPNLSFLLAADYVRRDSDLGSTRAVAPGATLNNGVALVGTIYDAQKNTAFDYKNEQYGGSVKIEYEIEDGPTISSLTAYRHYFNYSLYDQDLSEFPVYTIDIFGEHDSFQQEFLVVGTLGSLDYTAGAFFLYADADSVFDTVETTRGVLERNIIAEQETKSYSGFAQATWNVLKSTGITVGIRYTSENKIVNGGLLAKPGNPLGPAGEFYAETPPGGSELDASRLTWRFAVEHQFSNDFFGYLSANRGFKSGSFSPTQPVNAPAGPETLDAYEVGVKANLFNDILQLNLAAFLYKYDDIQYAVTRLESGTGLYNAAKGDIKGFEAGMVAKPPMPLGALTVAGGVSFLDTEYSDFSGFRCTISNPPPGVGLSTAICDVSGNSMIRAPKFTANIVGNYTMPLRNGGAVNANITYYHNDGYFFEPDNRFRHPAYDLLNMRLVYVAPTSWEFALYVKNTTDTEYYSSFSQAVGDSVAPGAPRVFGGAIRYRF